MLRPTWLKAFLDVFNDYFDTWAFADAPKRRSLKLKRALFIYVIPSVVACAAICRPFEIYNAGIVLTAVSILTALLFGLLVAVFDAAVNLHRDADGIKNAHNLNITLSDFRASITYEILVAILLVGGLCR
jgi:glucan phosphoethanolaminetransferase (alkaline phosphatase superfamily)